MVKHAYVRTKNGVLTLVMTRFSVNLNLLVYQFLLPARWQAARWALAKSR